MRQRARSTSKKWFWAARDARTDDIWNHRGVFLFGPSKKPSYIAPDRSWKSTDGIQGGTICYGVFTRLTGVVLKAGQVKKVFMPRGVFRAYEVNVAKPKGG